MLAAVWAKFCDIPSPFKQGSCDGCRGYWVDILARSSPGVDSAFRWVPGAGYAIISGTQVTMSLVALLLIATRRHSGVQAATRYPNVSTLHRITSYAAGAAGVGWLGLASWQLASMWSSSRNWNFPSSEWSLPVVQGLVWIVLAVSVSPRLQVFLQGFLHSWWKITFLLGTLGVTLSALDLINHGGLTPFAVLDIISWPVSCLFLIISFKRVKAVAEDNGSVEPLLNGNSCVDTSFVGEDESNSDDNVTPFVSAGWFSVATFSWLNPLLEKGYKRPLEHSDLPSLGPEDSSATAISKFIGEWNKQKERNPSEKPTVASVLAACHWRNLAVTGLFAGTKSVMSLLGPLMLNLFVSYAGGKHYFRFDGYVIVLGLFSAKILESLANVHWSFGSKRIGMQMRSALMGATFRKELRLSNSGRQRHTTGEVVNYMVVDAFRVGDAPDWFHKMWTTPIQIIVSLTILSFTVGWATLSGLAVILFIMVASSPLAKIERRYLETLRAAQDNRIRATSEVFRSVKILKLQAWELRFQEKLEKLRKIETDRLIQTYVQRAIKSFLFWMTPVLVSTATFTTCVFMGSPLNATNVFTALATLRIVQEPIRSLPEVFAAIIQAQVAMTRITTFLQEDELQIDAVNREFSKTSDVAIKITDGFLSWDAEAAVPTLRNINMEIKHGQHVAVCGTVGSGKSTLLCSLLGEISKLSGEINVSGTIAYVPQTAWIQTGSVRDNILFGEPMDKARYEEVLRVCALDEDIQAFDYGDNTEIGERGINLSGGQKQRIQMARAVYKDADIYILDDPFSAVDAHTGASIFKDCIRGVLSAKTIILVTHQVEFLPAVDTILLLQDGEIVQAGSFNDLAVPGSSFADLVNAHEETMNVYGQSTGSSIDDVSLERDRAGVSVRDLTRKKSSRVQQTQLDTSRKQNIQLIQKEEQETDASSFKPFKIYLSQARGYWYLLGAVGVVTVFLAGQTLANLWMATQVGNPNMSMGRLVGVYSALSTISAGFIPLRIVFVVLMGLATSRVVYSKLMTSLFRSPMTFFDSTPLGRILSRISSDLETLDVDIPLAFGFTISSTMNGLTTLLVMAVVTWQTFLFVIPVIVAARWIQRYYLQSARQLMRINATSKSPIVNHFGETIAGVTTIRAFGKEAQFEIKNEQHVNANASPYLHTLSAQEWLSQRLDFLCTVLLSCCGLVMVLLPDGYVTPGFAGLVLTYGLSLNVIMTISIQNQCLLANYIVSVERIQQYLYNKNEAPDIIEGKRPPPNWPNKGRIELQNLEVRYRPNTPLVLKGLTCTFEGGLRIGVVGRTGSGKTTLISSFFRLVEPSSGTIVIDGIDITSIGLHDLRSRLSIIPQEPVLFRGSVRFNLDPLGDYSDEDIWRALEKCQLADIIRQKPERLNYPVNDDGENWSVGQRQFFCLGRVLLKHNRVLILDEATASIDNTTDAILQELIREEFTDSTVITVAHRIPTVVDSDMIMALSNGSLVEYDRPKKLLENPSSLFAKLVAEYWSQSNQSAEN